MDIILNNQYTFILVLIRISVIITLATFFNDKRFPNIIKIGLVFLITIILTPIVPNQIQNDITMLDFSNMVMTETLTGLIIGFSLNILSYIFLIAGDLVDTQGGFAMAQVFDPTTQSQATLMGKFMVTVAMISFVANDFHHTIIEIAMNSFQTIPIGHSILNESILRFTTNSILYGVAIAAPIIGILFMIDMILGITTKTMPQINVFSVGFIIKLFSSVILVYVYMILLNKLTIYISNIIFTFVKNLS